MSKWRKIVSVANPFHRTDLISIYLRLLCPRFSSREHEVSPKMYVDLQFILRENHHGTLRGRPFANEELQE